MKIKQAAQAAELTEKAIRLYEERGLIAPQKTEIAGRMFRDYSAKDVEALRQIAVLRRAGFTLEEIKLLQTDGPANVLPNYRERLEQEVARSNQILAALQQSEPETTDKLADMLRQAIQGIPPYVPELSFEDEPLPPLPFGGLWLWGRVLPWKLHGTALALAMLLRERPMTSQQLTSACAERGIPLPAGKLTKTLRMLQRRRVITQKSGVYTVQDGILDRYDGVFTENQLTDFLAATQNTVGGKMVYTAQPPMSVSSRGPGMS